MFHILHARGASDASILEITTNSSELSRFRRLWRTRHRAACRNRSNLDILQSSIPISSKSSSAASSAASAAVLSAASLAAVLSTASNRSSSCFTRPAILISLCISAIGEMQFQFLSFLSIFEVLGCSFGRFSKTTSK